jgi:hypothetical protein
MSAFSDFGRDASNRPWPGIGVQQKRLTRSGNAPAPPRFLATDAPERFASLGEIFLRRKIPAEAVELVDLVPRAGRRPAPRPKGQCYGGPLNPL